MPRVTRLVWTKGFRWVCCPRRLKFINKQTCPLQVNRNTPVRTGPTLTGSDDSAHQVVYESFHGPLGGGTGGSPKIRSSTDDSVFTFSSHDTGFAHLKKRASVERTYSDELDGLATIRRPSAKVSWVSLFRTKTHRYVSANVTLTGIQK